MLDAFHHKSLRKILKISMTQVQEQHIKNEHLRNRLCVDNLAEMIVKRQANFAGKIARLPNNRLPHQIIGAWIPKARKMGTQKATAARTLHAAISAVLQYDATNFTPAEHAKWLKLGQLSIWVPLTRDKTQWEQLVADHVLLCRRRTWEFGTGKLGPTVLTAAVWEAEAPTQKQKQASIPTTPVKPSRVPTNGQLETPGGLIGMNNVYV
jgi:hypothetical protein